MIERYRGESRRRRWRLRLSGALLLGSLCSGLTGVVVRSSGHAGAMVWMALSVTAMLCVAACMWRNGRDDVQRAVDLSGARAVGALLEGMDVSFGVERREVAAQLARVLHSLEALHTARLTRAERGRLNEALRAPDFAGESDLLIAILSAYEQIGDEECLAVVAALAAHPGSAGPEWRVREAARRCLVELERRVESSRSGVGLLRASCAAAGSDTLLRAAEGAEQTAGDELLRPVESGEPPAPSGESRG